MRKLRWLPCLRADSRLLTTNEHDRVSCAREIACEQFPTARTYEPLHSDSPAVVDVADDLASSSTGSTPDRHHGHGEQRREPETDDPPTALAVEQAAQPAARGGP
jgi:hypothetical protein